MSAWIQSCLICNDGLCERVEELKKDGYSERRASEIMHGEAYQEHPELRDEFSASKIRNRYQYHMKRKLAEIPPLESGLFRKKPQLSGDRSEKKYLYGLSEDLSGHLGTKVVIKKRGQKGRVEIEFYNDDDLDRLISRLRQINL
jgi:hypothetical protein